MSQKILSLILCYAILGLLCISENSYADDPIIRIPVLHCVLSGPNAGKCGNGDGRPCTGISDCQEARCHGGKCIEGGTGRPCNADPDAGDTSCEEMGCQFIEGVGSRCREGGDGEPCEPGNPDPCKNAPTRCSAFGKCVPGGFGSLCDKDTKCPSRVCVESGDESSCQSASADHPNGVDCSKDETVCDQPEPVMHCTQAGKCVEGIGLEGENQCWGNDSDCNVSTCKLIGEPEEYQCMRGISGGQRCSAIKPCPKVFTKRCVDVGKCEMSGELDQIECTGNEKCKSKECVYENGTANPGKCEEVIPGTGEHACKANSDCKPIDNDNPKSVATSIPTSGSTRYRMNPEAIDGAALKKASENIKLLSANDIGTIVGSKDAESTLYVFQDLTCGMCRYSLREIIPSLLKDYVDTSKIKMIFVEFPLLAKGEDLAAAKLAKCTAKEGKYIEFIKLLGEQSEKTQPLLDYASAKLDLSKDKIESCVNSPEIDALVMRDIEVGRSLGIDGTPTFFLNGQDIGGASKYPLFREKVEAHLRNRVPN